MMMDTDEKRPSYFGGIYTIWKEQEPIFVDYFIYEDYEADTKYKADDELWEKHNKDLRENPFSELNQEIENIADIEIEIIESHLFNDEEYENVKEMLEDELEIHQMSRMSNDENVVKKRKDAYNMTDLMEALEYCLEMDELFGEEDED